MFGDLDTTLVTLPLIELSKHQTLVKLIVPPQISEELNSGAANVCVPQYDLQCVCHCEEHRQREGDPPKRGHAAGEWGEVLV